MNFSEIDLDIPREAIIRYIERRQKDVELCEEALRKGDFEAIARVGHQIKGNASTFGFPKLESVGIDMEKFGNQKNANELGALIEKLKEFVKENMQAPS